MYLVEGLVFFSLINSVDLCTLKVPVTFSTAIVDVPLLIIYNKYQVRKLSFMRSM